MAKFFNLEAEHVNSINKLIKNKRNNEYVVLAESNGFADIAQWSDKYQNVRIITVRSANLDWTYRLA